MFRSTLCQEVEVVALDMKFYLLIGISLAAMVMGLEAKRFVVVVDDDLFGFIVSRRACSVRNLIQWRLVVEQTGHPKVIAIQTNIGLDVYSFTAEAVSDGGREIDKV